MGNRTWGLLILSAAAVVVLAGLYRLEGRRADASAGAPGEYSIRAGFVAINFDQPTLEALGWDLHASAPDGEMEVGDQLVVSIESESTLRVAPTSDIREWILLGEVRTRGGILLTGVGDRVVMGNLVVGADADGRWTVTSGIGPPENRETVFELTSVMSDFSARDNSLRIVGELSIEDSWARRKGLSYAAGVIVGLVTIDAKAVAAQGATAVTESVVARDSTPDGGGETAGVIGPDIIVGDLQGVLLFGREGDISAYAVATNSCNVGDRRADWVAHTNKHPVIAQNMYRLKDNRFEQIGMSWVKHGFYAVSQSLCEPCLDATGGSELGVGCSDPYSASLNGVQGNMSLLSDVNAYTGYFAYPWTAPDWNSLADKRLQVHAIDLDPDRNIGALYFVQGHYIAADDAAAGNAANNASYRRVRVIESSPNTFAVAVTEQTQRGQAAIRAWRDFDPLVEETDVQVPGEGTFILASRPSEVGDGFWRYEYALQNFDSDRSAGSLSIPLPVGATVRNPGFHDVDYHSGEVFDMTEWEHTVSDGAITWSTLAFDQDQNANALRFSTLYNFRFEVNVGPGETSAIIGLFKPGFPNEVAARTIGPSVAFIDCNSNGISDVCDLLCGSECDVRCGKSPDCNGNGIPDECEPDCNGNGIADDCDIHDGRSPDCQPNTVPDECENDCDGDGIPDDCDAFEDADGDGTEDCRDACPLSTPPNACTCPPLGLCCFGVGFCIPDYPRQACMDQGGTPECLATPCRYGCLIGDWNGDGDRDLEDVGGFFDCFSGHAESPGFVSPSTECLTSFDFEQDGDVDLADFNTLYILNNGPRAD